MLMEILILLSAILLASLAWARHRFHLPKSPGPGGTASTSVLGHEIKNYLCTLRGNALLLRQRAEGQEQAAILDRIDRVVEKLEVFAANLRANEPGLKTQVRSKVDLVQIAGTCVRTHFPVGATRFSWDVPPALPGVSGDAGKLEQVFLNLYANALEAGATCVETEFRLRGDGVEVRVSDDGRGCSRETLSRIFEPFFSTKEGARKRGLGLFIVQSILADHKARIRGETKNRPGGTEHGLVFTLTFPTAQSISVRIPTAPPLAKTARQFPALKGSFSRAMLES